MFEEGDPEAEEGDEDAGHQLQAEEAGTYAQSSAVGIVGLPEQKPKRVRKPKPPSDAIKRPITGWLAYCAMKRAEFTAKKPNMPFGELANMFSDGFRNATAEEKAQLAEIVEKDKERYKNELIAKGIDPATVIPKPRSRGEPGVDRRRKNVSSTEDSGDQLHAFPLNKIKKIMKLDPDVKQIAGDAILAVTRCTEMFLASIVTKSYETSERRGTKTVHLADVIHSVQTTDCFEFLRLDIRKSLGDSDLDGAGVGSGKSFPKGDGEGGETGEQSSKRKRSGGGGSRRSSGGGSRSAGGGKKSSGGSRAVAQPSTEITGNN